MSEIQLISIGRFGMNTAWEEFIAGYSTPIHQPPIFMSAPVTDQPKTTDLGETPGINRTNLKALINRVKRDSGNRMSFLDAALFAGMMIDRELRECAVDMATEVLCVTHRIEVGKGE